MATICGQTNLGYNGSFSEGLNNIRDGSNLISKPDEPRTCQPQSKVFLDTTNTDRFSRGVEDCSSCSLKSLTLCVREEDQASRDSNPREQFHDALKKSRIYSDSSPLTMNISKTLYSESHRSSEILSSVAINNISATNNNSSSEPEGNCFKNNKWIAWILKYLFTYPLICLFLWALLYIFWGDMAFPGGSLFALIILEVSAICLGNLVGLLGLPPLFGMVTAGLILRNVPYIDVAKNLNLSISSPLRGISVVILLTRGAFSVNPSNIKKFKTSVPSIAIGSCVIEAICGGISAYFVIGFPPEWAALMGCILSAMSGAAVMPYLINIEKSVTDKNPIVHRNTKDAIAIAKTACGLDAILAICMAEFALGFIFGETSIEYGFAKGPAEVVLGGVFGTLWGGSAGLLLNDNIDIDLRILSIFSGGVMSLIGLNKIGYPRGGPLGVFLGSLVTISIWRHRKLNNLDKVNQAFDKLWFIFQPLLFGILGARTDFSLVDWSVVGQGAICLAISTVGRLISSFVMTSWSNLPFRERMFLVVAWMPKGTVQAALGPVALDTAIDLGLDQSYQDLAYKVMNIAATTVIISSFVGSLTLKLIGPRLLNKV